MASTLDPAAPAAKNAAQDAPPPQDDTPSWALSVRAGPRPRRVLTVAATVLLTVMALGVITAVGYLITG